MTYCLLDYNKLRENDIFTYESIYDIHFHLYIKYIEFILFFL